MNNAKDIIPDRPGPSGLATSCALLAVLAVALAVRANFVLDWFWQRPYEAHYCDETVLPFEALAMWEGVTPRELGWPASTNRTLLSACYAVDMAATNPAFAERSGWKPAAIMDAVVGYSQQQIDDTTRLYQIGRWVSVAVGMLQVLCAYWAVRRWVSPLAGLLAALICALAPIAVLYSQYVLTDMMGVLFVTWVIGLLAIKPDGPAIRPTLIGALLGLAIASKHHFGLWLAPALLAVWMAPHTRTLGGRFRDTVKLLLASTAVYLLMVPWVWTNPVLVAKEFLATALSKMAPANGRSVDSIDNLAVVFKAMGMLVIVGIVPGLLVTWHYLGKRSLPILAGLLLGVLLIARGGEVYDRHGLLFFPAAMFVAAVGFAGFLGSPKLLLRFLGAGALCAAIGLTGGQLVQSQRFNGEVESHAQAQVWLLENMKPGDRIVVDMLYTHRLPRTREQLTALLAEYSGPEAYARKMKSNGYSANPAEPMRQAVLCDELHSAHWLQRELSMRKPGDGFHVTMASDEVQYNAISADEAVAQFVRGLKDRDQGFDALLLDRPVDVGVEPARTFKGGPAPLLYLYLRPR